MSGDAPSTAREARERRKSEVCRQLAAVLLRAATPKTAIAAALGVRRQRLDDACDPDSNRPLSVGDLRALPADVRRPLLAWLADELGCVLVDAPPPADDLDDDVAAAARLQATSSAVVSEHLRAIADGSVDAQEASAVIGAIDRAVSVMLGAKLTMLRVFESRGRRVLRAVSGT